MLCLQWQVSDVRSTYVSKQSYPVTLYLATAFFYETTCLVKRLLLYERKCILSIVTQIETIPTRCNAKYLYLT